MIRSCNITTYCRLIIYSNKDVLFGQKAVASGTMMLASASELNKSSGGRGQAEAAERFGS